MIKKHKALVVCFTLMLTAGLFFFGAPAEATKWRDLLRAEYDKYDRIQAAALQVCESKRWHERSPCLPAVNEIDNECRESVVDKAKRDRKEVRNRDIMVKAGIA